MREWIANGNYDFDPAKLSYKPSLKEKIIYAIEDRLKHRFGEWKNYKLLK